MGKAYRVPTSLDRLRKNQKEIKDLQAINRLRNTPRPVASTAFAGVSAAGSEGGTGNFFRTAGDTVNGVFALSPPVDFRIQIDSDGIIDIGESSSNSQYTSNIQLDDIQPNTTTLDTIAGAAFDGQLLFVRTFAPGSITIAQATFPNGGNIQTPTDDDIVVGNLQTILFIFDASLIIFDNAPGGTWRLINTFGTGGGGGISFPIDFPEDDRGTVGASTQDILFTDSDRHSVKMIISGDVALAFSSPPTNETAYSNIIIVQDGTGGHTLTLPAGTVNKDIVEAGFLTGIDEETGIVVKFAFGIFYAFLETGNVVSGGGGATLPDGTIENQHIEWNNVSSEWEAKVNLEFGSTGPFADAGFIRFANDQIMLSARNPFDTGNVEIKTDSTLSRVDITDSGQGGSVGLLLRAQDTIDPDQIFSLSQGKGIGGDSILVAPTKLIIDAGVTSFAFALDATDLTLGVDLNVNTFDIFDIDQLTFMSTVGTLNSLNVGFGALGSGGYRSNTLIGGVREWTEENILKMELSVNAGPGTTSLKLQGVNDAVLTFVETTTSKSGSITKNATELAINDEDQIGVKIFGSDIFDVTSTGIQMQGTNFITTPQIGFSILGNLIQDDTGGMIFDTPLGDSFRWRDGTNTFASLDIDGFFLNDLYVQYQHIATPTVPGLITQGQVFFNTATNRLSFQRRNDGDTAWIISDLEGAASIPNQIVAGDSSISVVDAGTGAFSFVLDGVTVSTVDLSEWLFGLDLDIDSNNILNPSNIILANGFQIQNTSTTITTLNVPSDEDLIFAEAGTEVARYDGDNNNWIFNPANDVQLSPDTDVDLTPGGDIIMNPTGDIRVFEDLDMDGTNTIDFGTSASVPPGSALGAIQIKINGTTRLVKFYAV